MEYDAQPTPHLRLANGASLRPDPQLANSGYRDWVRRLLEEPHPDLWRERPWPKDHLVLEDGVVRYRYPRGDLGGHRLDLDLPLGKADLTAYLQYLEALPTQIERWSQPGEVSLCGCSSSLVLEGGTVREAPATMDQLALTMTRMQVPLPVTQTLYLHRPLLTQKGHPIVAELLIVADMDPQCCLRASAISLQNPNYLRRDGPLVQTGHLVTDTHPPPTADSQWTLWSYPQNDLWQRWYHHVCEDGVPRRLADEEPLPTLETMILVPGMLPRLDPQALPQTLILPSRYWRGAIPTGLEAYQFQSVIGARIGTRCQAKRPVVEEDC